MVVTLALATYHRFADLTLYLGLIFCLLDHHFFTTGVRTPAHQWVGVDQLVAMELFILLEHFWLGVSLDNFIL